MGNIRVTGYVIGPVFAVVWLHKAVGLAPRTTIAEFQLESSGIEFQQLIPMEEINSYFCKKLNTFRSWSRMALSVA